MKPVRLFAAAATVLALAACGPTDSTPPKPTSTVPPATSPRTVATVPTDAVQQLCDQIHGSLPDWRIQTPSLTHPALNVLVQGWAFAHGLNAQVISNRALVDDITTKQCPDTRNEALQALVLPNFAAGLVGIG